MALRRTDGSNIPIEELPTMKALARGETVLADEVVIHPLHGRAITTLVNARPIRRDDGEVVSVVATIQDITPLEEMKRQRTEFLSNVSHELRTPLTSIKGSTSTLLNSSYPLDPGETRQLLRVIDEQSDNMRNLINDLVTMTQIEAGTLSVNPAPIKVADLLDETKEAYIHAGSENSVVKLDLPSDTLRMMADKRRVLMVLVSLLASVSSNSPRPSTVRISAMPKDLHVELKVEDQTTSAATPPQPHQARRFYKTVNEVAGRRNGRDELAIAICEGIVEAHGGRLSILEGGGGRVRGFTFTIPAVDEAAHPAEQTLAVSQSAHGSDGRRGRILMIGENPETARSVRNTLSQAGFITVAAPDSVEAERLIQTQKPHVVLLEPPLPWADGFEELVHVGRISDAPIIFVAGYGWDQQIGRAFELGAFDYIAKPFTSTELLTRVDVAIQRRSVGGLEDPFEPYLHDDLTIDYVEREVTVSGRMVHLTATEYKLLTELSMASGRVLTHEQLLRRVWGPLYSSDSRIVRTYVKELRHKLGDDAAHPTYIFTEPGVGYRMARPSIA